MRMINENLSLNQDNLNHSCITPRLYEWGASLPLSSHFDVVLGSDIVYIEETYPLLIHTLNQLCTSPDVLVLLSAQERYDKVKLFMKQLLEDGSFTSNVVSTEGTVRIFRIQKTLQ